MPLLNQIDSIEKNHILDKNLLYLIFYLNNIYTFVILPIYYQGNKFPKKSQTKILRLKIMDDIDNKNISKEEILGLASDIVSAYVSQNSISKDDLPELISTVYNSLTELQSESSGGMASDQKPAISIRRSVSPDFIVCLEDGKKLKMLKRYLRTNYNMTPEEYRVKWNLPHDYPMVAPNYAKQRSEFAKNIGLGRGAKKK